MKFAPIAVAACLALSVGTVPAISASTASGPDDAPRAVRTLHDQRITESSGLVRSTRARPVLFTHNDSGDGPRLFAVGRNGSTMATLTLPGRSARDWEDLSTGPRHTLWLADIGDNGRSRDSVTVHRIREPRELRSGKVSASSFTFRYPDGAHDAEALLVHPVTGRLFLVSKSTTAGAVYRAPMKLRSTGVNRLTRIGSAPTRVTGASFSPRGKRIVLRTYGRAYVYRQFNRNPIEFQLPTQPQGESVTFSPRGSALLIGSEGSNSRVLRVPIPS